MIKEKVTKQVYLLFPVEVGTMKPNMESIAVFPNMGEALKAKALLKRSRVLAILLPILMLDTKEEFEETWKERVKNAMLGSLGCATSGSLEDSCHSSRRIT
jgi:hypothetical protein